MLTRAQYQHETNQRALKPRARAIENREARTGDLRGAFEIQNTERSAEIDVVLWLEIEFGFRAPAAILDVRGFICSSRNALMRNVGQRRKQFAHARLRRIALSIQLGNLIFHISDSFAP